MLKLIKNFIIYSIVMFTVSGCFSPETLVSLKHKILGTENDNPVNNPNNVLSSLSVNGSSFCLTQGNGNRLCWGGQSDYAKTETFSAVPSVLKNKTIKKISVATSHSCVIANDDKVYCWGAGEEGQLGNGQFETSSIPVAVDTSGVLSGKTMVEVYARSENTCAVDSNSIIYCWGNGEYGQLGDGGVLDANRKSSVPVLIDMTLLAGKTIKQFVNKGPASCVLASDDNAYCWGINLVGTLGEGSGNVDVNGNYINSTSPVQVQMPGALTIKKLGESFGGANCALASDDNVYCWGYGGFRISNLANRDTPAIESIGVSGTIKSLYMGEYNACAITTSDVGYCWGRGATGAIGNNNISNQDAALVTPVGSLAAGFKSFTVGSKTVCAIALDDKIYCWGQGTNGQLGNGANSNSLVPVPVDMSGVLNNKIITKIQIDYERVCAFATDNEIYCWGLGAAGTIGDGANNSTNVPTLLNKTGNLIGKTFNSLEGSDYDSTCAIASDDKVYCWGRGSSPMGEPELGTGRSASGYTPTEVYSHNISNQPILNVIYSKNNRDGGTCLQVSNGDVYCGANSSAMIYQFSLGSQKIKELFYDESNDAQCFIDDNDLVSCWGEYEDVMGNAVISKSPIPRPIDFSGALNNKTIKKLVMGYQYACVLASDQQVYCWGYEDYVGNGVSSNALVPTPIDTTGVLSGLEINFLFAKADGGTCVIADNQRVYCWGYGTGNGDISGNAILSPVEVSLPAGVKIEKYSAGPYATYLLSDDGDIYSWGYGGNGLLGNGAAIDSLIPVVVSKPGALATKKFLSVSGSESHTCAIDEDSQVYCWGYGSDGNLGNNSTSDSNVPVAISTSGVMSGKSTHSLISLWSTTCALSFDEDVYCWGAGQLGNNTSTGSLVPVEVRYTP
ncbi:hypothetical protein SHI21_16260 [Bacteriovorax sp. PP10]|uniref:Uncharacterized protein n=1 Tax=Bacteriovorax antarcticus TaxID=3088717 RepID=A0ABU5VXL2_9BACT|nr:hypothetical protein [Bacteriovorax sp. PP10]MEA9357786.1 hypothetical protein [Bacteriovorax sp. PP10]